jgi:CRP-like cAMP-binding protein
MRVRFEQDEVIFREGDPANRLYLIERGKVSLEAHVKNGPGVRVQTIGPGEVLGWSWLFPPYYWQFDARAVEPMEAIFFYGTRLREECEVDHELGYELITRMAAIAIRRLQATRKELVACHKQLEHPGRAVEDGPQRFAR